jgi:hypothetical protein
MRRLLIASLLFITTITTHAQDVKVPSEAKSFIAAGFEPLDYIAGDLNGDKKNDAILILKQPGEDTSMEEELSRPLIILIRQANGKLEQVARNDNAIMCRHCGGVFGDPYVGTKISVNGFTLNFYGGAGWRWGYDYKFMYRSAKKSWYLVKETQLSYQAGDPKHTTKNITIEEAELGEKPLESFDNNIIYPEGQQWKVKAAKTFFYDNPKLGSTPRKGYLLKNNVTDNIRELKNFVEVSFVDSKENITTGFILKKDLEKL